MNKKLIIAIVLLALSVFLVVICPTVELMLWFSIIGIIFSVISIVLSSLCKKEIVKNKGKYKSACVLCNIFGALVLLLCSLELIGTVVMNNPDYNEPLCVREDMVSDCVDQGEGFYSCKYMKQLDIPCHEDSLKDSQIK